jgi:hypothetical protein
VAHDCHLRKDLKVVALRNGGFGLHVCGLCLGEAGDGVELRCFSDFVVGSCAMGRGGNVVVYCVLL